MGVNVLNLAERTHRPAHRRAVFLRRGFTLLELMLVLAIAAVIAAMAVPRYGVALARYRADAAARRVAADLAYARQRARTTSSSVTVTFDAAAETYSIAGMPDPDHRLASYSVDLTQGPYSAVISGVDFASSSSVTFSGFGVPSAGGDVKVGSGKYARTVHVDGATGEATVQ